MGSEGRMVQETLELSKHHVLQSDIIVHILASVCTRCVIFGKLLNHPKHCAHC